MSVSAVLAEPDTTLCEKKELKEYSWESYLQWKHVFLQEVISSGDDGLLDAIVRTARAAGTWKLANSFGERVVLSKGFQ